MAVASVVPAGSPKYSPIPITFTQFLRFDISDGNRRIKVVQEIREQGDWDVSRDFYLGFRQKIRAGVRDDDLSGDELLAYAQGAGIDDDKRARYRANAKGLQAFERRYKPKLAGAMGRSMWSDGNLRVTTDPEAIFRVAGARYLTKIHLSRDVLESSRLIASLQLLREAYPKMSTRVAILDCDKGLLHRDTRLNQNSLILLRTTAAQFVGIWRLLDEGVVPNRIPEVG